MLLISAVHLSTEHWILKELLFNILYRLTLHRFVSPVVDIGPFTNFQVVTLCYLALIFLFFTLNFSITLEQHWQSSITHLFRSSFVVVFFINDMVVFSSVSFTALLLLICLQGLCISI